MGFPHSRRYNKHGFVHFLYFKVLVNSADPDGTLTNSMSAEFQTGNLQVELK